MDEYQVRCPICLFGFVTILLRKTPDEGKQESIYALSSATLCTFCGGLVDLAVIKRQPTLDDDGVLVTDGDERPTPSMTSFPYSTFAYLDDDGNDISPALITDEDEL